MANNNTNQEIDAPFFTIAMRCCQRPKMMSIALDSILSQEFKGIEVILIPDTERRGVYWANQQFGENTNRCDGRYVYALDDDCKLVDKHVMQKIHNAICKNNSPDILMVKCRRPKFTPKVLPKLSVWGKREELRVTSTNGGCFVSSVDVWKKYAHKYGGKGSGDWSYLYSVNLNKSLRFAWLDCIVQDMQQMGRGKLFEKCQETWFENIVTKYKFVEVNSGDWRLRLE